ncbi:hypothetical protein [Anabaena sp. PCC 7108]|uniref:hypothetical protein n=1 Tax=Anabaena sp. PCC 7108 TaxID=163908 RepID=UPI00034CD631|nr:hypothetical protein [Anabaena sp. PCC 7108]
MSLEIQFRNLVDTTSSTLAEYDIEKLDFYRQYEHYGIAYDDSLKGEIVELHLQRVVQESLCGGCDSDFKVSHLRKLREYFILSYIVDKKTLQPYLAILEKILFFITNGSIYSLDHENQWRTAIQAVKDIRTLAGPIAEPSMEDFQERYKRQFAVGCAAKNLKEKGYELSIEDGKVIMNPSEKERLIKQLEDDIKFLGGINVVSNLFAWIENEYSFNHKQERYHLVRTFDSNEPNVPVSYLINLAVKNPLKSPKLISGSPEDTWKRLIETSREFAAIFDVQLYERLPIFFQTIDTLVNFLQDITVYDSIFTLTQLRPSDVLRILRGLFGWIDRGLFRTKTGLDLDQIFEVIETIIQSANHDRTPTYYDFQSLASKMPNISHESLRNILDILSHEKSANHNLKFPNDISSVDFQFKPLLKTSNDEYVMLNPSWCSPAFYQAIISFLKQNEYIISYIKQQFDNKSLDQKVGHQIEEFIKEEFQKKGISCKFGKYKINGIQGECDLVVETKDTIIFIEVKKKELTPQAKGGNQVDIFLDITRSLIKAQTQLAGHEELIRESGCLPLKTGSRIDLDGRDVAKIAITLSDFGGLNDRNVVFLLDLMIRNQIDITDLLFQTKADKVQEEINDLLNKLNNLNSTTSNSSPFSNSWFLSVPQLLVLLDNVNSNESLKAELWKTRNPSTGTLDSYFEYFYFDKVRTYRNDIQSL